MYDLLVVTVTEDKKIKETCEKYCGEDVTYIVYHPETDLTDLYKEGMYVLLVCKEERHAQYFANLVFDKVGDKVFCIEGYEGAHYFERCIGAGEDAVNCACDILKTIYVDGVINLDMADFIQMISRNDLRYVGFEGNKLSVMNRAKSFLAETPISEHMANVFGSDKVDLSMELVMLISEYSEGITGACVLEQDSDLRLMLICRVGNRET